MATLGLDLGTSAVKALILDSGARAVAVASAPCRVDRPRPGWAEADPAGWLAAAGVAVRRALEAAGGGVGAGTSHPPGEPAMPSPSHPPGGPAMPSTSHSGGGPAASEPIERIGLAGQMHGVVVCDAAGRPVRPALLWPDRRAAGMLGLWRGLAPARRAALANPIVPGMAGPLLAWLAREEPATLARAAWALPPKDWLRLALTGEVATDPTDASATLLWDIPADAWAADVAAAAGIDASLLAPVRPSDAVAGALTVDGAQALGLPAGIPVCVGAADTAAALVGAGVTEPGQRLLNVGTGAQLVTVVDRPDAPLHPTTHRYRAAGGGWYAMAAVQNAGLALGWVRELFGTSWEQAEREAFGASARHPGPEPPGPGGAHPGPEPSGPSGEHPGYQPSGPGGAHSGHEAGAASGAPDEGEAAGGGVAAGEEPLFLPHLTGERTPLLDPAARGAWTGLALEHRRGDLVRAAYAGVAHAVRHAADALAAEGGAGSGPLRLLGGGSLRPGYRQLLADTLGEPLELLDVADATALGAARLAGGGGPAPVPAGVVTPDPAGVRTAAARHARWLAAVEALAAARAL